MIAQQPQTNVTLPEGTAFRIEPHQRVYLQLHYINYTQATADIEGSLESSHSPRPKARRSRPTRCSRAS